MSNESGASSGASIGRVRSRVVGLPKRCWCGEKLVSKMYNSNNNPYRRYYRCAFAVERKLTSDNHVYKWFDEAFSEEIEALGFRTGKIEQQIDMNRMEEEKKLLDDIQMKVDKEIALEKGNMVKMMVITMLGCLFIAVLSKIV